MPQIYGAVTAAAIFGALSALHIHFGPVTFDFNWAFLVTFIGLNAVFAIANLIYGRSQATK